LRFAVTCANRFHFDTYGSADHTRSMLESVLRAKTHPGVPPPLENGDHLTAVEFLRRYEAMPQLKRAELIEGVVYMGSPVRYASHGRPDALVQTWVGTYAAATPGVEAVSNTTAQLDVDNVPQPDALLRITEECGGQSKVDGKDYLEGAPELVIEVAASSVSIDTRQKLQAYRRNGVREYLIWLAEEGEIRCLQQVEGEYRNAKPGSDHVFRSAAFPGLWLDLKAALSLDAAGVLRVLQNGIKSRAHREFVARLDAAKVARGKKP
jgi:Uma2 family endonuclease